MKAISLILTLILLAGCASTSGDVGAARNDWFGARYDEVVSRWGTAVRSTPLSDGRLAYTWVSEGPAPGGSFFPSIGIFGGSGGVGVGVGTGVAVGGGAWARCERTLFFRDGLVVEQMWQGPAAYCSTFRRS